MFYLKGQQNYNGSTTKLTKKIFSFSKVVSINLYILVVFVTPSNIGYDFLSSLYKKGCAISLKNVSQKRSDFLQYFQTTSSFRIGSKLEKKDQQVLVFMLTGFLVIFFVMIYSVNVKFDISSENVNETSQKISKNLVNTNTSNCCSVFTNFEPILVVLIVISKKSQDFDYIR